MTNNNSAVMTVVILGVGGIIAYFIYEKYIKKPVYPNLPNSAGSGNFFQSTANSVSNFLSSVSQPNSALTNSGLLNNAGQQYANQILGSPAAFNDLQMQSELNNNVASPNSGNSSLSSLAGNVTVNYNGLGFIGELNNAVTTSIEKSLGIKTIQ